MSYPQGSDPRTNRTAFLMLAAHILSMLGFSTYAALLPELSALWRMSNAEAGIVGGAFFIGYVGTVSYWTALTDRADGRRVYLIGSALAVAGGAGFGLAATNFASAMLFQVLLGAGIAGTYMPGLRLLTDQVSGTAQSRYVAFYTSFFGIGTALSLALAGFLAPALGWRAAFVLSAAGPAVAGVLVLWGVAPAARKAAPRIAFSLATLFPVGAWRRVLANRASAGYALGYGMHCLELFGSRTWLVAFLAFSAGLHAPGASFPWNAAAIAAVVNVVAVPASIVGNEIALRIGRRQWITLAMAASGLSGILLGFAAPWHWMLVGAITLVYAMLVMAESATLTAGMVAAAPADLRGAAMGLYSLVGFAGGMLGPVVFGVALDAGGGAGATQAWPIAYGAIGAGCIVASLVAWRAGRATRARSS
ncbi:MAG: MFS transporter [Burkholderiales bacterium]|nr:MFS transporter [Burkholderiales bacterium]